MVFSISRYNQWKFTKLKKLKLTKWRNVNDVLQGNKTKFTHHLPLPSYPF